MTTYFPYSEIISEIRNRFEQTRSRHNYLGDWQPTADNNAAVSQTSFCSISEIYY